LSECQIINHFDLQVILVQSRQFLAAKSKELSADPEVFTIISSVARSGVPLLLLALVVHTHLEFISVGIAANIKEPLSIKHPNSNFSIIRP
jgi:hypothetical protein